MKALYVIPARGGSKGIPHKNIKLLNGKPLIYYSIAIARQLTSDENICITSDDPEIVKSVEKIGLKVPFLRPSYLATDIATTNDVLLHVLDYYETKGQFYDILILLQPTSPLRNVNHVKEALKIYNDELDMVVSVKQSSSIVCIENNQGFIELCFTKIGLRRQDMPLFYEYNGSIYIINSNKLKEKGMNSFTMIKKYVMDDFFSIDIDNQLDWIFTESILKQYPNEFKIFSQF